MSTKQTIDHGGPAFPCEVPQRALDGTPLPVKLAVGMTLRDYACIKLRVPRTGKPWLDEIIVESRRDAFAGQALPAVMSLCQNDTLGDGETPKEMLARKARLMADAMTAGKESK